MADLMEVATVYLFYLCRNHAFVDGNKRTGLGACFVFLNANNLLPDSATPTRHMDNWEGLVLDIAATCLSRQ
ncbi:MAG TPA: Fic family protein [Gammaproteobacteria bacterium]|nr:Fic family protein [Gammaproteobacteria bacterium]